MENNPITEGKYSNIDIRFYLTPEERFLRVWTFCGRVDPSCFEKPTYNTNDVTRSLCEDIVTTQDGLVRTLLSLGLHENTLIAQLGSAPMTGDEKHLMSEKFWRSHINCNTRGLLLGQATQLPALRTKIWGMNGSTPLLDTYEEPAVHALFDGLESVRRLREELHVSKAYTFRDFCEAYALQAGSLTLASSTRKVA